MVLDGGRAFKQFKWISIDHTAQTILEGGQPPPLWPVFPR